LENNGITKNINQYDCTKGLGGIYPTDKKIILTTDPDLIKDGVQSIDDEFLEWFVKNPSCEEVEVADLWKEKNSSTHDSYQIIIPQEEPKQKKLHRLIKEKLDENEPKQVSEKQVMYNIGDVIEIINPTKNQPKLFKTHKVDIDFGVVYYYQLNGKEETIGFSYIKKEEPKQETLEEVNTSSLENLLENNYDFNVQFHQLKRESIFSFAVAIYGESLSFKEWQEKHYGKYIEISKWQQEQDKNKYSEEDMIAFGWFCREKSLTMVELLIDKFKN
jgi:hypothetical protein